MFTCQERFDLQALNMEVEVDHKLAGPRMELVGQDPFDKLQVALEDTIA
jgi:hypothetical protein